MEQKKGKMKSFFKNAALVVGGVVLGVVVYKNRQSIGNGLKSCGKKIGSAISKKDKSFERIEIETAEPVVVDSNKRFEQPQPQVNTFVGNGRSENNSDGYRPRYERENNKYRNNN